MHDIWIVDTSIGASNNHFYFGRIGPAIVETMVFKTSLLKQRRPHSII